VQGGWIGEVDVCGKMYCVDDRRRRIPFRFCTGVAIAIAFDKQDPMWRISSGNHRCFFLQVSNYS
jgi:hypothetical protein